MKNIIFALSMVLVSLTVNAQIFEPVKWNTSVTKLSDTEYELIATAFIDNGWHLYSQSVPEDGPQSTKFTFKGTSNFLKKGNTTEEKGHTINDPVFKMQITYFEKKAVFRQKIKSKSTKPYKIKGSVEFMVCDNSKCLPPTEVELVFNIK
ncbi:protein-disulfide reductase DsbD domain-containing protein [Flavobacterium aquidurense]|uniref:protein-disulfide reductase DsbD domain-containing protein n=1 Tax=Flavobacterium aquidurense TaxID=362413 RepID=UPI00371A103F